jgi:methylphosphotriester-DNA--protein-cysteine methyltransferase
MTARTYRLLGPDRQPYQSATPGALGGYRPARIYGRLDCPAALRAIARGRYVRNRVFFAEEQTAIAAGYRPCVVRYPACRSWSTRRWPQRFWCPWTYRGAPRQ